MSRWVRVALPIVVVVSLALAGCGGSGADKVDGQEVTREFSAIMQACIGTTIDPGSADGSEISTHVSRLLHEFENHPDAKLDDADIKAKTMRGAMEFVSQTLDNCKPEDASRVNDALAK